MKLFVLGRPAPEMEAASTETPRAVSQEGAQHDA